MKKGFFKCINLILILLLVNGLKANAEDDFLMEQLNKAFSSGTVYVVSQDGLGDFTSIQDGVDAASSGDTLFIYPGIYVEAINIENKTINLLGANKEQCIVQYDTSSYYEVPLNLGAGEIANLTIYGMSTTESEEKDAGIYLGLSGSQTVSVQEWRSHFSGYAIHIDQNYSYGKDIIFTNCKIVSENNHCVGIGCRGNSTIRFENCEFISGGDGGCVYIHDTPVEIVGGVSKLQFVNCDLKNYINPYVMTFHSMLESNEVYLTFQNVKVSTVAYDNMDIYVSDNFSTIIDAKLSSNLSDVWDKEKSKKYIKAIRQEGALNYEPELGEGITLLTLNRDTDIVSSDAKQCSIIYIYNETGQTGSGWSGLENVFLTKDSYGNSLLEMNTIYE